MDSSLCLVIKPLHFLPTSSIECRTSPEKSPHPLAKKNEPRWQSRKIVSGYQNEKARVLKSLIGAEQSSVLRENFSSPCVLQINVRGRGKRSEIKTILWKHFFFVKKTQGNFIQEIFQLIKKWGHETNKILFFDVRRILIYKSVHIGENYFQCSFWRKKKALI